MSNHSRPYHRKIYEENRQRLDQIKLALGCMDCGYREHAEALDFDHRPGEVKRFSIGGNCVRTWKILWAEIQKCDVVCANCHRVRTWARKRGKV